MGYKPDTVAATMGHINGNYFLPAIQREFVWTPEKVVQLFDSLMRGYPISSFLFWELKPENRDRWQVYRFVQDATSGGTHNDLASTDGVLRLYLIANSGLRPFSSASKVRTPSKRSTRGRNQPTLGQSSGCI
jgi:hypothetical protein